jgi:protein tyrosine phosphatase
LKIKLRPRIIGNCFRPRLSSSSCVHCVTAIILPQSTLKSAGRSVSMSTIASLQLIPCDQTIKILQGRELDRHQYSLSKPAPQVLSAYSTLIGNARENASKNRYALDILTIISCAHAWPRPRYRDIIAYDRTRVLHSIKKQMDASKEQEEPDSGHSSNYVNASLILEPDLGISGLPPRRYFIAAQVNYLRTF